MGEEIKLKAGAAGNQKGKPPSGTTAAGIASAAMQERKRRLEPGANVGSHQ